ncbi:MAG: hypothetical protein ACRDNJ_02945 [Solirubrobacteraceae bacterium]
MTSFEDTLWSHLVDEHAADRIALTSRQPVRRITPVALTAGGAAGLAVAAAAAVLLLSGTTGTPPAYALTAQGDGTYTLTLNELSAGTIPALNAKLAQLGIDVTAVPIEAGCTDTTGIYVQEAPGSLSETVTVGNQYIDPGQHGFLAAEQLPDGHIGLAMGTTAGPIPSCFPATPAASYPSAGQGS